MSANAYLDGVRTHRVRRRKDPKVVSPALHTGIRNNGIIEIDLSDEEDSDLRLEESGTVFKLSSASIKEEFMRKTEQYVMPLRRYGFFTNLLDAEPRCWLHNC